MKNTYLTIKNVAFIALMSASTLAYGMENDGLDNQNPPNAKNTLTTSQWKEKEEEAEHKKNYTQFKIDRKTKEQQFKEMQSHSERTILINTIEGENARDDQDQKRHMNQLAREEKAIKMRRQELELRREELALEVAARAQTIELQMMEMEKERHLMQHSVEQQTTEASVVSRTAKYVALGYKTESDVNGAANKHKDLSKK